MRRVFSAAGTISPAGAKTMDGGVELYRRLREGVARPFRSQVQRELLVPGISCRCIDFDVPVASDLNGDVGGCAKSIEA